MKNEKQALVPWLRFPEFREAGEWKEKLLGDCLDYLQPTKYLVSSTDYDDKYFTPVLTAGKTFVLGYTNETKGIFKKGLPVIIFDDFTTASKFVDFPFKAKSSAMKILLAKEGTEIKFIYEAMKLIRYEVGVHERHWISIFSKLSVPFPAHFEEQQKIADCLSSLDALIAAQADKIDALKAHKKGLMQQLFPREGETVPRLRFPEFRGAGEWEWRPLGEIAEIKLGKMLDKKKHRSGHLLPYLNNLAVRWNDFDTSDLPKMYFDTDELEKYHLAKGDVIVCEGGEPGRSAVWDGRLSEMKFQKALHRVRFQIQFVPHLLVHYLETIAGAETFESLFTGGGIKHLTRQTFAILPIPVASPAEQDCIANCLSFLDALISAHKEKLDVLKAHKKGLMQKLFPMQKTT